MQVDNNYNNYNNYKVNFGAKRIMSAEKVVGDLKENFEVYRLNEYDIPFVKKLILVVRDKQSKFNNAQRKLFNQLKEFLDIENYNYYEKIPINSREKKLYLGIKNSKQISGFMQIESSNFAQDKVHDISDICLNVEDEIAKDTFVYAYLSDKSIKNEMHFLSNYDSGFNRAFDDKTRKKKITDRYPGYKFKTTGQREDFNLYNVLRIEE